MVGDQPFSCDGEYDGIGVGKTKIKPLDFRFWVHDLALVRANGEAVSLSRPNRIRRLWSDPRTWGNFGYRRCATSPSPAPYMHDGSIATLAEVIDHYAAGGRKITEGLSRGPRAHTDGSQTRFR